MNLLAKREHALSTWTTVLSEIGVPEDFDQAEDYLRDALELGLISRNDYACVTSEPALFGHWIVVKA